MYLNIVLLLAVNLSGIFGAKFSFESGHCDVKRQNFGYDIVAQELCSLKSGISQIQKCRRKQIEYHLYTRKNPYERQILNAADVNTLKSSHFNPEWPVRLTLHGWTDHGLTCANAAVKDAYLARGDFNVIIVDYSVYTLHISYVRLSENLPKIARDVVRFVNFLHAHTAVPYEHMYFVGHSAGAHAAGLAGKLIRPQQFGAIYGIDPAGLTQLGLSAAERLAPTDAIYVESIHTDTKLLGNPSTELSQAAFFVNWGLGQTHCPNATGTEHDFLCDHYASVYYFAASIRSPLLFGALQCETSARYSQKLNCGCGKDVKVCEAKAFMGGEPAVAKRGVYYLSTASKPPYGYGNRVYRQPAKPPNFMSERNKIFWPITEHIVSLQI